MPCHRPELCRSPSPRWLPGRPLRLATTVRGCLVSLCEIGHARHFEEILVRGLAGLPGVAEARSRDAGRTIRLNEDLADPVRILAVHDLHALLVRGGARDPRDG